MQHIAIIVTIAILGLVLIGAIFYYTFFYQKETNLEIDIQGGQIDKERWQPVDLKKGDLVFFDSQFIHCVEPVTSGKRQVIVFWAHGKSKL